MPLHDWSQVPSGLFHDFHQSWAIRIKDALNSGLLPEGISALVEQLAGPKEPDVLAVKSLPELPIASDTNGGGLAVMQRSKTSIVRKSSKDLYADKANRIVLQHHRGRIIAVVEIVSPGNKGRKAALRDFVEKTVGFLRKEIHVLVIDLLPPMQHDPDSIHKAIWDEIDGEDEFALPNGKDRMLVSYETGNENAAYIEPVAVGDKLPDMPLFLTSDVWVLVPLYPTYTATWDATPEAMRTVVETGVMPEGDEE